MKPREAEAMLKAAGFEEFGRSATGHRKYRHKDDHKRWTTISFHPGDIPPGTLRAIEKQTGVKLKK